MAAHSVDCWDVTRGNLKAGQTVPKWVDAWECWWAAGKVLALAGSRVAPRAAQ